MPGEPSAELSGETSKLRFNLRLAVLSDAREIMQVHHDSTHALSAGFYNQEILDAWAPISDERLQRIEAYLGWSPERGLTVVAQSQEPGAKILGFCRIDFSTGEIASLYVSPEAAGRGLGRLLLSELEKKARNVGLGALWLIAALNARAFYRINGFFGDEQIEFKLPNGVMMPLIKMRKQLLPLAYMAPWSSCAKAHQYCDHDYTEPY